LTASEAFFVNTISLESEAFIKDATFLLADSYSYVAFALHPYKLYAIKQ